MGFDCLDFAYLLGTILNVSLVDSSEANDGAVVSKLMTLIISNCFFIVAPDKTILLPSVKYWLR